jgi:tetratricopeptide (TPR) repeat protein
MADEKKENMIKAAEKLLKQGRIQQALAQYEDILSYSPDDTYVLNRIGDLYVQFGKHAEAKKYFRKIAAHYEAKGFEPQAMAIWKKIIKLDAMDAEACFKLAELFQNRSLMMEAKRYYLTSAESFLNQEDYDNAKKSYDRLLLLEPDNMKLREKISEVLITAGKQDQGAEEYLKMASVLEEQGLIEKAMKYYRKAISLDPVCLNAAEDFLERVSLDGMKEQVIFFAEDIFFNMPEKGQAASILANLFIKLKRYSDASKVLDKALKSNCDAQHSVKRSFGRLSLEEGKVDEGLEWFQKAIHDLIEMGEFADARDILNEFVERFPEHVQALQELLEINKKLEDQEGIGLCYQRLEKIYQKKGMLKDASAMREKREQISGAEPIRGTVEEKSSQQDAGVAIMVEEESVIQDEESVGLLKKSEFIEKQITLADVYQKYQLYDQVVHHLDEILKKFPDDHEVRERLIPALDQAGDKERMVKETLRLAKVFEEQKKKNRAETVLQKALEMVPEDQSLQRNLDLINKDQPLEMIQEEPSTEEAAPQEKSDETFEIEIDEQEDDEEKYESISRSLGILKEKIKEEIESDDYKSHYDLGIAYKEMGLIEEAIQEFDIARGSQEYFILSSLMMGLCHRLAGDFDSAEKMIHEGLESAQSDEQRMEFWYEMADILFQKEEYQESLNLLNQILKIDPKYRNTAIKAEKLIELIEESSQE